jgi:hypothetical protein
MPYTDRYNREGKYTGEINEYGQPHGHGALRYNNGMVYEGLWVEGQSEGMDHNMGRAKDSRFGNWKTNTKAAKAERAKRKEEELEDLRSFISQSVRSGMTNASGSQQGERSSSMRSSASQSSHGGARDQQGQQAQQQQPKDHVSEMPWSDVNGFSGHYTGEVNSQNVPDGSGFMQYTNGIVEEGLFCNGVYQPPSDPPERSGGVVPSSSMSVWSIKSSCDGSSDERSFGRSKQPLCKYGPSVLMFITYEFI